MYYITVKQPPMYHQMTLEEFLFGEATTSLISNNISNTRTYLCEEISDKLKDRIDVNYLIMKLKQFNERAEALHNKSVEDLYETFYIPKHSGGYRRIDAPKPDLMLALRTLKEIFENDFGALYHTSAFAYIKRRSTLDCVKRHQRNESKWFLKLDLSDFFGSTTQDFVMKMFGMIFPFCEVLKEEEGREAFSRAISLAFLNGGLPQGTPISPTITNIMMIPVDHVLSNSLRDFKHNRYVYTRYADDFLISSKYSFKFKDIEEYVTKVLASFGAGFRLNKKKTRYGSANGSNWNLGVMLNKDNEITIGSKKKRQFETSLFAFAKDEQNGNPWSLEDIQRLEGFRSYYRMVEGETIDKIVGHVGNKCGVDIMKLIKDRLSA